MQTKIQQPVRGRRRELSTVTATIVAILITSGVIGVVGLVLDLIFIALQ